MDGCMDDFLDYIPQIPSEFHQSEIFTDSNETNKKEFRFFIYQIQKTM